MGVKGRPPTSRRAPTGRRLPPRGRGRAKSGAGLIAVGAVLVAGIAAVLLLVEPAALIGPTGASQPGAPARSVAGAAFAIGAGAPDFEIADLDGRPLSREALTGRPALMWFTTSYCLPCQEGARRLGTILDELGATDQITVVIVFVDPSEPAEALRRWRDDFGRPDWLLAYGDLAMARAYNVQYLDTKVLLDASGVVRAADSVPLDAETWTAHLQRVLPG